MMHLILLVGRGDGVEEDKNDYKGSREGERMNGATSK